LSVSDCIIINVFEQSRDTSQISVIITKLTP